MFAKVVNNNKIVLCLFAFCFFMMSHICDLSAQNNQADKILGVWLTEKKDSKIQILKKEDGNYYAKIIWTLAQYKSFEQMVIIKNLVYVPKDNEYVTPWIYSPRKKISAKASLTLKGNILYVKATKALISVTEEFTRVTDY